MNILETITERTKERIRGEKKQIPINEIRKKAEEKASSDTTKFDLSRHFVQRDFPLSARQKRHLLLKD